MTRHGTMVMMILMAVIAMAAGSLAQAKAWDPATRPSFPIGCYQQPVEALDAWKARGVDCVVGPELGNPRRLSPQQYCEAAASRGLWVIANKFCLEGGGYRPPNLMAWALDDEPNSSNHLATMTPAAMAAQAAAFRRIDPGVPVFMSLAGDAVTNAGAKDATLYQGLAAACDVWSEDWYPINREYARYPIAHKGTALGKMLGWAPAKPRWSIIECSWQRLNASSPKGRGPTPDELEAQAMHVVLRGASGIIWFSTCDSGAYGWDTSKRPNSYDPTPDDVATRMKEVSARLRAWSAGQTIALTTPATPPTQPTPPATQPSDVADLSKIREDLAAIRAELNRIFR